MSESEDDECFYNMKDLLPVVQKTPEIIDEPISPIDENFYEINEDISQETAYIDEPLTPSDESKPNFQYSIITPDEYLKLMLNYVNEVKDILQLSKSVVIFLLNRFKWNKQRLLEQFYEKDPDEFLRQTKAINDDNACSICYSDSEEDLFSLECQHQFCKSCWQDYIIHQIVTQGHAQNIVCPKFQCKTLVDEEIIFKFLENNDSVKHLYEKIMFNSFVDNNPRARWCPGQNCGRIIHATSLTSSYNYAQLITCSHCQTSFCFHCGESWHDPIKCYLLIQWKKKLTDDNQNLIWLKINTKKCPKCQIDIEKNGGCDHMTCRNCSHEFCWICFGLWSKHQQCNQFTRNQNANEQVEALRRYQHYHDRYRNHEHSIELERRLLKKVRRQLKRNIDQLSSIDIQIIEKAFEILLDCRQLLIFTYPFAYYLVSNNQSIVFEQNQADLERVCEELTHCVEQDLSKEIVFEPIRKTLQNHSKYCQARKNALLKHVKEGYVNNYWQYVNEIKNI